MPELPEVEVVRRGLESHLGGRRILDVRVKHPRPIRSFAPGAAAFSEMLRGRRVDALRRRGKYLWWVLDSDALVAHLGMSGQFRFHDPREPEHRHTRVVFELDDGREARFLDQRMFGGFEFVPGGAQLPVAHIAPDPFDDDFDEREVAARLLSRHTAVKRALLDQRLVSGIGNIYADEALWRAQVYYGQPGTGLGVRKALALLRSAREVMSEALEAGGTSFDSLYVNVNGESGYFARDLSAYGREGLPCYRCGAAIRREPFMNRSSFYCPRCQRRR